MKSETRKRITYVLLTLTMLCGCSSEEDHTTIEKKVVPLTTESARDYYYSVYGDVPKLKSYNEEHESLIVDWDAAQLYSDSLWYAVESPIDFNDSIKITLMTNDVSSRVGSGHTDEVKQVLRLVILRNKETGKTVSFIMVVIPDYDYMIREGDMIHENKYLSRTSHLDGAVLFYGINGEFVNGWVYEDGKIIDHTTSHYSKLGGKATKQESTYCWVQVFSTSDGEEIGRTYYCEDTGGSTWTGDIPDDTVPDHSGGGIDNGYSDPSSGGGNSGDSGSGSSNKQPKLRTDCSGNATQNATNAQNVMNGSIDIKNKLTTLRNYAKNNSNEFSSYIGKTTQGNYTMGTIIEGDWSSGNVEIYESTLYNIHTHSKSKNSSITDLTGPSAEDIYSLLEGNQYFASNGYTNLKGIIILAYDGSEYLLYINERSKAVSFANSKLYLFESNEKGSFASSGMANEYTDIVNKLKNSGYSIQNSNDYAYSYLLDKYATGLKISKKENSSGSFKEMKTEKTSNNYEPKICP